MTYAPPPKIGIKSFYATGIKVIYAGINTKLLRYFERLIGIRAEKSSVFKTYRSTNHIQIKTLRFCLKKERNAIKKTSRLKL